MEITICRSCQSTNLKPILSLGNQHLVGFTVLNVEVSERGYPHAEEKPTYMPLELVLCTDCNLLQLKHTTPPDLLWNENYGYRSGINETMQKELSEIVGSVEALKRLEDNDIVVDIACNDGTLLKAYKNPNLIKVGYDPSRNVIDPNTVSGKGRIFIDFFSKRQFLSEYDDKAKVVTCIAMIYDLEEPHQFLKDVEAILDPEGIFVVQQNYLVGMLKQCAFDNIVHEHLEYYSLLSFENLLAKHNLEVFDVSENNINGGSFRTYIRFKGASINKVGGLERVQAMRDAEAQLGLDKEEIYLEFATKCTNMTKKLSAFINGEVSKGKKIYVYGASTRGNTLLQAAQLDHTQITAAAERNTFKWGRKCVGTNIPIISEGQARKDRPDYFLVLPWFFAENFKMREKEYVDNGGTLIFPLPEPYLYNKDGIIKL